MIKKFDKFLLLLISFAAMGLFIYQKFIYMSIDEKKKHITATLKEEKRVALEKEYHEHLKREAIERQWRDRAYEVKKSTVKGIRSFFEVTKNYFIYHYEGSFPIEVHYLGGEEVFVMSENFLFNYIKEDRKLTYYNRKTQESFSVYQNHLADFRYKKLKQYGKDCYELALTESKLSYSLCFSGFKAITESNIKNYVSFMKHISELPLEAFDNKMMSFLSVKNIGETKFFTELKSLKVGNRLEYLRLVHNFNQVRSFKKMGSCQLSSREATSGLFSPKNCKI